MTGRTLRYSVGNENNPTDPWGRSELVIQPNGAARLDHHFSRLRTVGGWTGNVDAAALDGVWAGLERAGFPVVPSTRLVADGTLRRLIVEADGTARQAYVDWHRTASLPGYAEAFDVLDGVIRQLSGGTVKYPTTQPPIVRDIKPV